MEQQISTRVISYAQAICEATDQAMQLDPSVIVIGQGTRDPRAIFGSLTGLFDKYGPERVMEMPLSENAIAGICIGAAFNGFRPVFILQRADFLFLAMDQLMNHAAKWYFMFGGSKSIPVTIRCIIGKGWGQGPQHSQSLHAICSHFPGLRVSLPATPYQAKGLLLNSIFSNDPSILFEARPLYDLKEEVPSEPYVIPFGKATIVQEGTDLTLAAISYLTPEAKKVATMLSQLGYSAEVVDITSSNPIDYDTIQTSVVKTGRLVILDVSWKEFGLASELSAEINERLFGKLKGPVQRITIPPWPTPTAAALEKEYYPSAEVILERCKRILGICES